jgi:hypothetical protein
MITPRGTGRGTNVGVSGPVRDASRRVPARRAGPRRTRALVVYAGRRTIGLPPTAGDIAFARDRLVRKHANAHRGSWLAGIALTCLIIGILFSVHITIQAG